MTPEIKTLIAKLYTAMLDTRGAPAPWTKAETTGLIRLAAHGYSHAQIAARLGRSERAIANRLLKLRTA